MFIPPGNNMYIQTEERKMKIDYKRVFEALRKYLEEQGNEFDKRDYLREIIEGYYLGTVSEERFLKACDDLDNDLWDDYKDMYEPNCKYYGIPLEHYVYALQEITGKRPKTVHRWNHLQIKAKYE